MKLKNKFKARPSAAGVIMTTPDADRLPATVISYVHAWIKSQPEFYNRAVNFTNKYTDKGIECEDDSIELAGEYFGWPTDTEKNEITFENDYLIGTPDVVLIDSVEDIKNSWSEKTFPLFYDTIPNKHYEWQLQCYMDLCGKTNAGLIYTLMDAPEHLIDRECRYIMAERGIDELTRELYDEVAKTMSFSELPLYLRVKRFELEYDHTMIRQLSKRVNLINKYIEGVVLLK